MNEENSWIESNPTHNSLPVKVGGISNVLSRSYCGNYSNSSELVIREP